MAVPNDITFYPFDIFTAEEANKLVANDKALAAGTAFDAGAIPTSAYKDASVTADKIDFTTFPDKQSWTPSLTGFSVVPPNAEYYYTKIGRQVTLYVSQPTNGTSNSTAFQISLPFKSDNISSNFKWSIPIAQTIDNGSVNTTNAGVAIIDNDSTYMYLLKNMGGNIWTASGGKRVPWFQITYLSAS